MTRFGKNLKKYRELAGLTQAELAKKLKVSQKTVCAYETYPRIPSYMKRKKIADILGIELNVLMGTEIEWSDRKKGVRDELGD